MKIRLSKALVIKKRVGAKIGEIDNLMIQNNSYVESYGTQQSVSDLYDLRKNLSSLVTQFKVLINKANLPIFDKISTILELKSEFAMLKTIPTKDGKFKEQYGQEVEVWKATLSRQYVDNQLKDIQKKIDKLQEAIDAYNAVTEIEIPSEFDSVIENM